MHRSLVVLSWLFLATFLTACGGNGSGSGKLRIAVIPKGSSHEFWKAVERGARRAEAELGDVEVIWKGPESEGMTDKQIQVVESFIAENYNGICLAPLDARALERPVQQAIDNGIPVVIFDSGLANDAVPIVSYVATDNKNGGKVAADHLATLMGGKGRVLLLRYMIGSESTEQREQGFLEAIAKYPEIELLLPEEEQYGGPDERSATQKSENLLVTLGDRIDGIFTPNESNVSGMLNALGRDQRGLAGKIPFVGFDSSPNIVKALGAGTLHAVVLQDPVEMGYQAVKTMAAHLRGGTVDKRIPTGETLATGENMNEPRVHALLFPLEDQE